MSTLAVTELEKYIREADLKALDEYQRGRADAPVLYKAEGQSRLDSNGPMVFIASEESEDRVGDVIAIDGWDLKSFRRNPVWMFIHNLGVAPLGTVPKIWTEGKQLLNTVDWDSEDELARFIKGKYDRHVMRAVSVGFRALEFEERNVADAGMRGRGILFKKQELLEISAVPVPMHPHALQKVIGGKAFSIIVPEMPTIVRAEVVEDGDKDMDESQIGLLPLIEAKTGAVLNKTNKDKLSRAMALIQEVMATATTPQEETPVDDAQPKSGDMAIDVNINWKQEIHTEQIRQAIQNYKVSLQSAKAKEGVR